MLFLGTVCYSVVEVASPMKKSVLFCLLFDKSLIQLRYFRLVFGYQIHQCRMEAFSIFSVEQDQQVLNSAFAVAARS